MFCKPRLSLLAKLLIGCLLGILGTEFTLRSMEQRLGEPLLWHTATAQAKVESLRNVPDGTTVIIGTSQVMQGIDPAAFAGPTFNAGLSSGVPSLQHLWLADAVLPSAKPDMVIWGLNPLIDFNAGEPVPRPVVSRYLEAPATDRSFGASFLRSISSRLAIVRARSQLADSGWRFLLTGRPVRDPSADALGYRTFFGQTLNDQMVSEWERWLQRYRLGTAEDADQVIDQLVAADAELIVVEMPVSLTMIHLLPGSVAEYRRLQATTSHMLRSRGVRVLRPPRRFEDPAGFADLTHFGRDTAQDFSAWIAAEASRPRPD